MPFPGPTTEQPAKIMEIFDVLSQLEFEQQDAQRKKYEKENKRRGKN